MHVNDHVLSEYSALVLQYHLVVNVDLNYDFLTFIIVTSFALGIFSANI